MKKIQGRDSGGQKQLRVESNGFGQSENRDTLTIDEVDNNFEEQEEEIGQQEEQNPNSVFDEKLLNQQLNEAVQQLRRNEGEIKKVLSQMIALVSHAKKFLAEEKFSFMVDAVVRTLNKDSVDSLNSNNIRKCKSLLSACDVLTSPNRFGFFAEARSLTLNNFGCMYKRSNDFSKALVCFQNALQLQLHTDTKKCLGYTHLNVSAILSATGEHSAALQHAKKALIQLKKDFKQISESDEFNKEIEDSVSRNLALALYNIAVEEEHIGCHEEAKMNYQRAVSFAQQHLANAPYLLEQFTQAYNEFTENMQKRGVQPIIRRRVMSLRPTSAPRLPKSVTTGSENSVGETINNGLMYLKSAYNPTSGIRIRSKTRPHPGTPQSNNIISPSPRREQQREREIAMAYTEQSIGGGTSNIDSFQIGSTINAENTLSPNSKQPFYPQDANGTRGAITASIRYHRTFDQSALKRPVLIAASRGGSIFLKSNKLSSKDQLNPPQPQVQSQLNQNWIRPYSAQATRKSSFKQPLININNNNTNLKTNGTPKYHISTNPYQVNEHSKTLAQRNVRSSYDASFDRQKQAIVREYSAKYLRDNDNDPFLYEDSTSILEAVPFSKKSNNHPHQYQSMESEYQKQQQINYEQNFHDNHPQESDRLEYDQISQTSHQNDYHPQQLSQNRSLQGKKQAVAIQSKKVGEKFSSDNAIKRQSSSSSSVSMLAEEIIVSEDDHLNEESANHMKDCHQEEEEENYEEDYDDEEQDVISDNIDSVDKQKIKSNQANFLLQNEAAISKHTLERQRSEEAKIQARIEKLKEDELKQQHLLDEKRIARELQLQKMREEELEIKNRIEALRLQEKQQKQKQKQQTSPFDLESLPQSNLIIQDLLSKDISSQSGGIAHGKLGAIFDSKDSQLKFYFQYGPSSQDLSSKPNSNGVFYEHWISWNESREVIEDEDSRQAILEEAVKTLVDYLVFDEKQKMLRMSENQNGIHIQVTLENLTPVLLNLKNTTSPSQSYVVVDTQISQQLIKSISLQLDPSQVEIIQKFKEKVLQAKINDTRQTKLKGVFGVYFDQSSTTLVVEFIAATRKEVPYRHLIDLSSLSVDDAVRKLFIQDILAEINQISDIEKHGCVCDGQGLRMEFPENWKSTRVISESEAHLIEATIRIKQVVPAGRKANLNRSILVCEEVLKEKPKLSLVEEDYNILISDAKDLLIKTGIPDEDVTTNFIKSTISGVDGIFGTYFSQEKMALIVEFIGVRALDIADTTTFTHTIDMRLVSEYESTNKKGSKNLIKKIIEQISQLVNYELNQSSIKIEEDYLLVEFDTDWNYSKKTIMSGKKTTTNFVLVKRSKGRTIIEKRQSIQTITYSQDEQDAALKIQRNCISKKKKSINQDEEKEILITKKIVVGQKDFFVRIFKDRKSETTLVEVQSLVGRKDALGEYFTFTQPIYESLTEIFKNPKVFFNYYELDTQQRKWVVSSARMEASKKITRLFKEISRKKRKILKVLPLSKIIHDSKGKKHLFTVIPRKINSQSEELKDMFDAACIETLEGKGLDKWNSKIMLPLSLGDIIMSKIQTFDPCEYFKIDFEKRTLKISQEIILKLANDYCKKRYGKTHRMIQNCIIEFKKTEWIFVVMRDNPNWRSFILFSEIKMLGTESEKEYQLTLTHKQTKSLSALILNKKLLFDSMFYIEGPNMMLTKQFEKELASKTIIQFIKARLQLLRLVRQAEVTLIRKVISYSDKDYNGEQVKYTFQLVKRLAKVESYARVDVLSSSKNRIDKKNNKLMVPNAFRRVLVSLFNKNQAEWTPSEFVIYYWDLYHDVTIHYLNFYCKKFEIDPVKGFFEWKQAGKEAIATRAIVACLRKRQLRLKMKQTVNFKVIKKIGQKLLLTIVKEENSEETNSYMIRVDRISKQQKELENAKSKPSFLRISQSQYSLISSDPNIENLVKINQDTLSISLSGNHESLNETPIFSAQPFSRLSIPNSINYTSVSPLKKRGSTVTQNEIQDDFASISRTYQSNFHTALLDRDLEVSPSICKTSQKDYNDERDIDNPEQKIQIRPIKASPEPFQEEAIEMNLQENNLGDEENKEDDDYNYDEEQLESEDNDNKISANKQLTPSPKEKSDNISSFKGEEEEEPEQIQQQNYDNEEKEKESQVENDFKVDNHSNIPEEDSNLKLSEFEIMCVRKNLESRNTTTTIQVKAFLNQKTGKLSFKSDRYPLAYCKPISLKGIQIPSKEEAEEAICQELIVYMVRVDGQEPSQEIVTLQWENLSLIKTLQNNFRKKHYRNKYEMPITDIRISEQYKCIIQLGVYSDNLSSMKKNLFILLVTENIAEQTSRKIFFKLDDSLSLRSVRRNKERVLFAQISFDQKKKQFIYENDSKVKAATIIRAQLNKNQKMKECLIQIQGSKSVQGRAQLFRKGNEWKVVLESKDEQLSLIQTDQITLKNVNKLMRQRFIKYFNILVNSNIEVVAEKEQNCVLKFSNSVDFSSQIIDLELPKIQVSYKQSINE